MKVDLSGVYQRACRDSGRTVATTTKRVREDLCASRTQAAYINMFKYGTASPLLATEPHVVSPPLVAKEIDALP
jgi:hypothetical protein